MSFSRLSRLSFFRSRQQLAAACALCITLASALPAPVGAQPASAAKPAAAASATPATAPAQVGFPAPPAVAARSFLLIDMKSPGVTVRPIVLLDGEAEVNEVFFDNVRVPKAQRVGDENAGWTIAKSLLEFERLKLARIGESKRRMARAREAAETRSRGGSRVVEQS